MSVEPAVSPALREIVRGYLGLRKVRKIPGGPRLEKMAAIAVVYWRLFRVVDWDGGELKLRAC